MKTVNDFAFYLATFSLQKNYRSRWENLDRGQYPFQPIKFVDLVVPSPCETEPYNKKEYKKYRSKIKRYRKKIKKMAKKCNRHIVY